MQKVRYSCLGVRFEKAKLSSKSMSAKISSAFKMNYEGQLYAMLRIGLGLNNASKIVKNYQYCHMMLRSKGELITMM